MPPCKDCNKELIFVKTHDGSTLPIERHTPVFAVHLDEHSNFRAARAGQDLGDDSAAYLALHICEKKERTR